MSRFGYGSVHGKPCGGCDPCQNTIEKGMWERLQGLGKCVGLLAACLLGGFLLAGCASEQRQPDKTGESVSESASGSDSIETASGQTASAGASAEDRSDWSSEEWERYAEELAEQRRQEELVWYHALTEEEFANAKTPDQINADVDWHQRTLILLGELPEVSVRVYGEIYDGEMMILEHQGQRRTFFKGFLTPRVVMPKFAAYDYDGDGTQEIGMICYVGSGTGVAIMDFSVFDSEEEPFDTLYTMSDDVVEQACGEVAFAYEEGVLRIGAGEDGEEHDLTGTAFDGMKIRGVALGDIVSFAFGDSGEVYCSIELALALEDRVTPFFVAEFASLYEENGVPWENNVFGFQVHYDGGGAFWYDEPGLEHSE
ncbi:MAG: hypothetical protein NC399_01580 [Muribaculum sp.]|nr:hypothetical protein [Muribaculum sp.]